MTLESEIEIGGHVFRNRLAFASHIANLNDEAGAQPDIARCVPGKRAAAYYARRAAGGVSLIVTEEIPVHSTAFRFRAAADPDVPGFAEGLRQIADRCRESGAITVARLAHPGAFADFDHSFLPSVSPSGFAPPTGFHGSQAASDVQIADIVAGYARTAATVVEAGMAGVEIDAGPLSLIEQFWAPALNQRDDQWGGIEGGLHFAQLVLGAVRAAIGPKSLMIVYTTLEPDPGIGIGELQRDKLVNALATTAGADILHFGLGTYSAGGVENEEWAERERCNRLRALQSIIQGRSTVMVSGSVLDESSAEDLIAAGVAQLVGMTRGMIADPDFASRAVRGQVTKIRPCVACNQNCRVRRSRDYSLTCLVNPDAGRESRKAPVDGAKPLAVTVVGAGPAGLEAGLEAARLGHRVKILEQSDDIGGQLNAIANQPMRHRFRLLLEWYRARLAELQVEIITGVEVTADILMEEPDRHVILATGALPDLGVRQRSAPHVEVLAGVESGFVIPVEYIMSGQVNASGNVLLLDDCEDWKSLGSALWLAESGAKVCLVTRNAAPGVRISAGGQLGYLRKKFRQLGIEEICNSQVRVWHGDSATLRNLLSGEEIVRPFDVLVTANTSYASDGLSKALNLEHFPFGAAGDCVSPRNVGDAIREGRAASRNLTGQQP